MEKALPPRGWTQGPWIAVDWELLLGQEDKSEAYSPLSSAFGQRELALLNVSNCYMFLSISPSEQRCSQQVCCPCFTTLCLAEGVPE